MLLEPAKIDIKRTQQQDLSKSFHFFVTLTSLILHRTQFELNQIQSFDCETVLYRWAR